MNKLSLLLLLILTNNYLKASTVLASSFGYSSINATITFQSAIQSANDTIIIDLQASDWNVAPNTFNNLNSRTIIFQEGVILKAIPGLFNAIDACLLRFNSCSNINLIGYGASLKMNKNEYVLLNDSEYRMSISLWDCSDICIKGLIIDESGGDGIYVGGENSNYCQNIVVEDVQCINHYRQGMSTTSVQNMTIKNSYFANTQGTLPEAGIDVEPYQTTQRIVNLKIEDCRFENNGWAGIALALVYLDNSSIPISIEVKDCVLKNNSLPTNTYVHCEIFVGADDSIPVQGNILFERCFIVESQYGAFYSRKTSDAFTVHFKDCVFQNVSLLQELYNEPIFLEVPSYSNPSPYLGGFNFEDVFISYPTNFNFFRVYGWETLSGIKDIVGNFTIVEPNNNGVLYTDVPDTINCTYTFINQSSLPNSTVGINATNNMAIECSQQKGMCEFERTSSNTSYPLGISYITLGTAALANDTHLLTKGIVIPSISLLSFDTINARNDGITELNETLSFNIQNSSLYTLATNNTSTIQLIDCQASAIPSLDNETVRINPNPATSYLTIENTQNQKITIGIFNVVGELMISKVVSKTETIEIQSLPSGLYFVGIVNNANEQIGSVKIIKQ